MELKRHYVKPEGWEAQYNFRNNAGELVDETKTENAILNPLPDDTTLKFIEIIHTGTSPEQNLQRWVPLGVQEGWITLGRGKLIMHVTNFPQGYSKKRHERNPELEALTAEDVDLEYTIVRAPGVYCCHCGVSLGVDSSGRVGRVHVATAHKGEASPDLQNPSGYTNIQSYQCVLNAEQHARFSFQARFEERKQSWRTRQQVVHSNGAVRQEP